MHYCNSFIGASGQPKQDSVRFGSVWFGFFRITELNIYRIKSKIKGLRELFFSVIREVSLLRNMDHSKISAVMIKKDLKSKKVSNIELRFEDWKI